MTQWAEPLVNDATDGARLVAALPPSTVLAGDHLSWFTLIARW